MKRFLIRLSALVGVIAVGVFAIVQAQRTISRAEAREQNAAAEPSSDKSLAKTKTENKLRSDSATGRPPWEECASLATTCTRPSAASSSSPPSTGDAGLTKVLKAPFAW